QPRAVAPAVEPLLAVAARRKQPLFLIEAQRPRAHRELLGEVADREDLAANGTAVETGHQPWGIPVAWFGAGLFELRHGAFYSSSLRQRKDKSQRSSGVTSTTRRRGICRCGQGINPFFTVNLKSYG